MKILHILDHSLPLHSGYSFRSLNILRAQVKRGWRPLVITSPKHEESWREYSPEREEIEGLIHYRTGTLAHNGCPLEAEIRLMKNLAKRILDVAESERPDILHAHSPILNVIPALYAGRKLGIPVVYEIRAFWEDAAVDHGTCTQDSLKYKLIRSLETWVCRKADQVAILCNGLKNDLVSRGISREKITVVFNGVNVDDFKPCEPDLQFIKKWQLEGKTVIGFIGSFYRYEGLDLLVDAFARLAATRSDIVLLLVGGGEVQEELKHLAHRIGIGRQVLLPGRLPHETIPGVYANIDILVYPRHSMRLTELVTPLKPLEAMAMGKALIASDVGGHKELITHNLTGLLFPSGQKEALASSISQLLLDDRLQKQLQTEGARWVREHHTWERTTSVYDSIYSRAFGALSK